MLRRQNDEHRGRASQRNEEALTPWQIKPIQSGEMKVGSVGVDTYGGVALKRRRAESKEPRRCRAETTTCFLLSQPENARIERCSMPGLTSPVSGEHIRLEAASHGPHILFRVRHCRTLHYRVSVWGLQQASVFTSPARYHAHSHSRDPNRMMNDESSRRPSG